MADKKITELTAKSTAVVASDLVAMVEDVSGSPLTKKCSMTLLRAYINNGNTIPSTGDILTTDNTKTLTNKTFDAEGTGNVLTGIKNSNIRAGAGIDALKIGSGTVSNTVFGYLAGARESIQDQLDRFGGYRGFKTGTLSATKDVVITEAEIQTALGIANTLSNAINFQGLTLDAYEETSTNTYSKIATTGIVFTTATDNGVVHLRQIEIEGSTASIPYMLSFSCTLIDATP